ncbi:ribosome biogenesis GTPase Der [Bdellovibrionota bacterium FG-2]
MNSLRVVVMGRPNVGKSSLFNRLLGRKHALVHDEPGVTRDRIEKQATWWSQGKELSITLVDTGGVGGERFVEEIQRQVDIALSEAHVAVLVFDGQSGVTAADEVLVRKLHSSGVQKRIPIVAVVNKIDAPQHEDAVSDFHQFGFDSLIAISAEHNRGVEELKDTLVEITGFAESEPKSKKSLKNEGEDLAPGEGAENADKETASEIPALPRIAIVGRPNVGKSTMLNALLGKERMITSSIAGTTVDAVDSIVELEGKQLVFVDTAGIRRKSKTEQGVEVLSVLRAKKALEDADLAILLLDGESGLTDQDEKIGGLIEEAGCSVIIAMNKWDTQLRNREFPRDVAAEVIREKITFLKYAPIVFVSGKQGKGFEDLGGLIEEILKQKNLKIPTREFTEFLREECKIYNPQDAKFFMCHQTSRHPPTFMCHVNDPERVNFSMQRHLVNAMRERFGFMGSPIRLLFAEGKNTRKQPKRAPHVNEARLAAKKLKKPSPGKKKVR